jgi:hypothetical protein
MKKLWTALTVGLLLALSGCAVYTPAYRYSPGYYAADPYYYGYGYPGYAVIPPTYGLRFGYGPGWYGRGWGGYGWRGHAWRHR